MRGAVRGVVGRALDPFWLVRGSPAILTLLVFIGVRLVLLRQAIATPPGLESEESPLDETEPQVEDRP